MTDPVAVTIGSLVLDGATLDANGTLWHCTDLTGWWDSAPERMELQERAQWGEIATLTRLNGRPITLGAVAQNPYPQTALGQTNAMKARDTWKRACDAQFLTTPLLVNDGFLALQSNVRLVTPGTKAADQGWEFGTVLFSAALLALDPRRYSQTQHVVSLGVGTTIVNNAGDLPTPVILTTTGGTNPSWTNNSADGGPNLTVTGTGAVVIDTDQESVTLGGVPSRGALTGFQWWQLVPGNNSIVSTVASTITFRDAYS